MDMGSAAAAINYWAVLVSAVVTFGIGGLWYSPALFARIWMAENGFREEDLKGANMAKIFGTSLALQLISAFMLAMFVGPQATAGFSALAGFMVGIGWVATSFGVVYLFERRSWKLWLINAGYHTISFTVMGVILGVWR
jgi:hypothetical protein